MARHRALKRLALAIVASTIASLFIVPLAAAQPTGGGLVVRVESPASGSTHRGAITFTGLAVDGATNQPATRVAVNDHDHAGAYLADVSMDTIRQLTEVFPGRSGSAQMGWTLIFDSNRLADGRHTLDFVAYFPSGGTATTTTEVVIANNPYVSPVYRGTAYRDYYDFYGGSYYNGVYYNRNLPYYNTSYNYNRPYYNYSGAYWVNGMPFYNGAPNYTGTYFYNGVYYYNGNPYYNGSYYYPGTPSYAPYYPGGYWYNNVYYPTGAVNTGLGWYYQNGIWFYRPGFSIYR